MMDDLLLGEVCGLGSVPIFGCGRHAVDYFVEDYLDIQGRRDIISEAANCMMCRGKSLSFVSVAEGSRTHQMSAMRATL